MQRQDFEKLFTHGVRVVDVHQVLWRYIGYGAKVAIEWERDGGVYIARLLVSTIEDLNELDQLRYVFNNSTIRDFEYFTLRYGEDVEKSKRDHETELLNRFGVQRDELETAPSRTKADRPSTVQNITP